MAAVRWIAATVASPFLLAGAIGILVLGLGNIAAAQDHALTLHAIRYSDLPVKLEPVTLYYSPNAEDAADRYAERLAAAVDWYRAALGWNGPLSMAVLNADDYARFAGQVYPVPYAEVDTGLVVMPDSIATFPGFESWGLDAGDLNTDLTLHEIGHAIARDIGLWSASFWVNELVANVFLAAYLRAEIPDDRILLAGVPPGFADAARTTNLVDLDDLYSNVGLDNYAWFQFRLAAMADYLAADTDFATLIAALKGAFPAQEARNASVMPTPEEALRRLETIKTGTSALAADLLGRPNLPAISTVACRPDGETADGIGVILVENQGADTLRIGTRDDARFMVRLDFEDSGMSDEDAAAEIERLTNEALAIGQYGWAIPPNHRRVFRGHSAGTQQYVAGGGCLIVPEGVARFVWTGG